MVAVIAGYAALAVHANRLSVCDGRTYSAASTAIGRASKNVNTTTRTQIGGIRVAPRGAFINRLFRCRARRQRTDRRDVGTSSIAASTSSRRRKICLTSVVRIVCAMGIVGSTRLGRNNAPAVIAIYTTYNIRQVGTIVIAASTILCVVCQTGAVARQKAFFALIATLTSIAYRISIRRCLARLTRIPARIRRRVGKAGVVALVIA